MQNWQGFFLWRTSYLKEKHIQINTIHVKITQFWSLSSKICIWCKASSKSYSNFFSNSTYSLQRDHFDLWYIVFYFIKFLNTTSSKSICTRFDLVKMATLFPGESSKRTKLCEIKTTIELRPEGRMDGWTKYTKQYSWFGLCTSSSQRLVSICDFNPNQDKEIWRIKVNLTMFIHCNLQRSQRNYCRQQS